MRQKNNLKAKKYIYLEPQKKKSRIQNGLTKLIGAKNGSSTIDIDKSQKVTFGRVDDW